MIDKLIEWINESENIVFLGGAGVSTESGIPDFRSTDGLYNHKYKYSPEIILSHDFFINNTHDFYEFYKDKMIFQNAKPNKAHLALAELEKRGKLNAIITQNIDGLHQMAGSKDVLELHGSIYRNFCVKCGNFYDISVIINEKESIVPICKCGGIIKPDVVLYGESLDYEILEKAQKYIESSDMMIIGGTSLGVYPAAGLVGFYNGTRLVLINKSVTHIDSHADLVLHESIGDVLNKII